MVCQECNGTDGFHFHTCSEWAKWIMERIAEKQACKPDETSQLDEREEQRNAFEIARQRAQTPKWTKSPVEIADGIADDFFVVTSFQHADLRRQIIEAIEAEREVTMHYMTQMGRWWSESNHPPNKSL